MHRRPSVAAILSSLLIGLGSLTLGCGEETFTYIVYFDSHIGDAVVDAGPDLELQEAGSDADACVPAKAGEICDGKDNDCNGKIDDVPQSKLDSDAKNCGKCQNLCTFANAFSRCTKGKCAMGSCAPGYLDLNKDASDGCEYFCVKSNNGVEACDGLDNDCDKKVDEDFDLKTSANNCGACGLACSFNNAGGSCSAGVCKLGACKAGYVDLDKSAASGCEYKCPVWPAKTTDDCDGVDADCDGKTDEDFVPKACGSATGQCQAGKTSCIGGGLVCKGKVGPSAEKCNGLDDDCDGKKDETFDKLNDPRYCGGCVACKLSNAFASCKLGVCGVAACNIGWVDLDKKASNGCEYNCLATGAELCDGKDNDCDGKVDTADPGLLKPGAGLCAAAGACQGVKPTCKGSDGWVCAYGADVELQPCKTAADCNSGTACSGGKCVGQVANEETRCDGKDNDCDGKPDEIFTLKGAACLEPGKTGLCQGSGAWQCNAAKTGLSCKVAKPGSAPKNEVCNGVDDDCDGKVDEEGDDAAGKGVVDNMVQIIRTYQGKTYSYWIYRFEATRPDASATSAGSETTRACSKKGALPWSSVTFSQAEAACKAAGKRLCSPTEWYLACTGPSNRVYPYGNTYQAKGCNGRDYSGSWDKVGTGGAFTTCKSSNWIWDLSGNLKEWVDDPTKGASDPEPVRGGAFDTVKGGLRCDFSFAVMPKSFLYANLGFRCCSNVAP